MKSSFIQLKQSDCDFLTLASCVGCGLEPIFAFDSAASKNVVQFKVVTTFDLKKYLVRHGIMGWKSMD